VTTRQRQEVASRGNAGNPMKLVDRRHRVYVPLVAVMLITVSIISSWKVLSKQMLSVDRVTIVHKNQINPTLTELAGAIARAQRSDDMVSDTEEPVVHRSAWWI
jgi:hypothetical protein